MFTVRALQQRNQGEQVTNVTEITLY